VALQTVFIKLKFLFQGEFLLSAQGGLGMFVTAGGTSNRPPLRWSYPVEGLTYHDPYIIGMSSDVIMVHRYGIQDCDGSENLESSRTVFLSSQLRFQFYEEARENSRGSSVYYFFAVYWIRLRSKLFPSWVACPSEITKADCT